MQACEGQQPADHPAPLPLGEGGGPQPGPGGRGQPGAEAASGVQGQGGP